MQARASIRPSKNSKHRARHQKTECKQENASKNAQSTTKNSTAMAETKAITTDLPQRKQEQNARQQWQRDPVCGMVACKTCPAELHVVFNDQCTNEHEWQILDALTSCTCPSRMQRPAWPNAEAKGSIRCKRTWPLSLARPPLIDPLAKCATTLSPLQLLHSRSDKETRSGPPAPHAKKSVDSCKGLSPSAASRRVAWRGGGQRPPGVGARGPRRASHIGSTSWQRKGDLTDLPCNAVHMGCPGPILARKGLAIESLECCTHQEEIQWHRCHRFHMAPDCQVP